MKVITSIIFALIIANANADEFPFKISKTVDSLLFTSGVTLVSTAMYYQNNYVSEENVDEPYDIEDVSIGIDRYFARKYDRNLDKMGTAACVGSVLCLPLAVYLDEFSSEKLTGKELGAIGLMYVECYLFEFGIKNVMKVATKRNRPYMYFEDFPREKVSDNDFQFSFPSAHTTDAFMGATFLSYTFCKMYPDSDAKVPLIVTSYSLACITGALRMASGNHFLTDVVSGAVLGSLTGFVIPFVHTFNLNERERGIGIRVNTDSIGCRIFL